MSEKELSYERLKFSYIFELSYILYKNQNRVCNLIGPLTVYVLFKLGLVYEAKFMFKKDIKTPNLKRQHALHHLDPFQLHAQFGAIRSFEDTAPI